jgi:putative transposase
MVCSTISGEWSISTAWCWTSSFRIDGTGIRLVTYGLKSYGVAQHEFLPEVTGRRPCIGRPGDESGKCSGSRRPGRLSVSPSSRMIYGHSFHRRRLIPAGEYRRTRTKAFQI